MSQPVFRLLMTTIVLLLSGLASACLSQETSIDALGLQVGEIAPDFTLSDQHGREHSLESLLGPDGLVLVFIRSADW